MYEREAVLGRDTSSVFPKEAEKAKKEHLENIKKAVGLDSSRFITESQVSRPTNCSRMQVKLLVRMSMELL